MSEFEDALKRIDGVSPSSRLKVLVHRDREIFKAGMLAAAEMAQEGSSSTPQIHSRHSIRLRIANRIRAKAEELT